METNEQIKLESFVKTTLNQQNEYYKLTDEYNQSFMVMVRRLKINEETLASTLKLYRKKYSQMDLDFIMW